MKIRRLQLNKGMASLTLVLIVVAIISLIMVPILLFTYIRNSHAVRFYHSQQAFFAAEGAYAETIARINKYEDWIPNDGVTYSRNFEIPPNTILRNITRNDGVYHIEITAENRMAQRKIEGYYSPSQITVSSAPYDLILVLDYSSSMNHEYTLPDGSTTTGMAELKIAVPNFIDTLTDSGVDIRMGIVRFDKGLLNWPPAPTPLLQQISEAYANQLKTIVIGTTTGGGTNHFIGLNRAAQILNDPLLYDNTRERIVIIFSDGGSSYYAGENRAIAAINNYKLAPETPLFEPAQYFGSELRYFGGEDSSGISASDPAIQAARSLRRTTIPNADNASIYSIFYKSYAEAPERLDPSRFTMFAFSSEDDDLINHRHRFDETNLSTYAYYKETDDPTELSAIFSAISDIITSKGTATYREIVPD